MADEEIETNNTNNVTEETGSQSTEGRVIDESDYKYSMPAQKGPAAMGRGGDPFYRNIYAPKEQLQELLEETMVVQDWVQKETCNNVALACLDSINLKDVYYEIKDGFGEYGPIMLMGFKTPQGVEIPRLKILDTDGEVLEVLTGPMAMDELNKRALAYKEFKTDSEDESILPENSGIIEEYHN